METQNTNLQTLNKIKIIISAAYDLYIRLSIVTFIVGLSVLSYYLINKYFDVSAFYINLLEKVTKPTGLVTTVAVIFILGILLSIFKNKQQLWYGMFETIFALVSCYFAVRSIKPSIEVSAVLLLIGSTLYLIVRGINNVLEGSKKSYWLRKELKSISDTTGKIPAGSITKMLRDKEVIVDILISLIKFVDRFLIIK
jgi:hypothetical protein